MIASNDCHLARPHLGETRQVQAGQQIHDSVFQQMEKGKEEAYSPLARLPDGFRWGDVGTLKEKMIEEDPYTDGKGVINELSASSMVSIKQLEGLANVIVTGEL
jgi:hypothetical protein